MNYDPQPHSIRVGLTGKRERPYKVWVLDQAGRVFDSREFATQVDRVAWVQSWGPLPVS